MWSKGGKGWISLWAAPVGSGATGRAVQGRQRRPAGLSTPERSEPPGARSASSTYPPAARSAEIKEGGSGETIFGGKYQAQTPLRGGLRRSRAALALGYQNHSGGQGSIAKGDKGQGRRRRLTGAAWGMSELIPLGDDQGGVGGGH